MVRWHLTLQLLPTGNGNTRCPLCGATFPPAASGYGITKLGDATPVCDACAMKQTPELIPARAAANEAARVRWETGRQEATRVREKTRLSPADRLDAMERVEENLDHRHIALVESCPVDRGLLMEELVGALDDNGFSTADLQGVAYISPDDTAAMHAGEDFTIGITLPPGDDGHDAEARTRAVAEVVWRELVIAGVPFDWRGDDQISVLGARSAVGTV